MANYLFIYSAISILLTTFLVYSNFLKKYFIDKNDSEPQKIHSQNVGRNGGIIFLILGISYFHIPDLNPKILVYMYIFLFIGLSEDLLKNIKASRRFVIIIITSFVWS